MASRQRRRSPKKTHVSKNFINLGMFENLNLDMKSVDSDTDIDENSLESELEAILSGKGESKSSRPKKKDAAPLDIEKIIAECMNDFSDENENSGDESVLADPDLLKELEELTLDESKEKEVNDITREKGVCHTLMQKEKSPSSVTKPIQETPDSILSVLEERLDLYKHALSATTELGDKSKARRFNRAVKTLEELIKSAKSNKPVNSEDIPPIVIIPKEKVLPNENPAEPVPNTYGEHKDAQISSFESAALSAASEPEDPTMFAAPPAPNSILEALEQRYQKYASTKSAAEAEGNTSRARRLQRIVKLYEESLKNYKAGKEIDFGELPTPPGFAPIPISSQ